MAITKSKKEQIVSKLSSLLKNADLLVFLGFKKLSVAKANELRRKLRGVGASYLVAKKRLARIVLLNEGVEMPKLEGQTAFILSGKGLTTVSDDSAIAVAKEVQKFAKANKETVSILGGVFQRQVINAHVVTHLAQIPSREVLIAQVLGVLSEPLRGFMGVLNGNQRKFVTVLRQIVEKK